MITLLTDFGLTDHFVGVMKGVITSIAPDTQIIDITHDVPPFSIAQGAFLLDQAWRYFPKGTIHLAIVDPGVGSTRRPLLIRSRGHYFIGPDNGIFTHLESAKIRHLDQPKYWLPDPSNTFHGRDIFSPVAAHLANGVKPASFGSLITDPVLLTIPPCSILHIDRFGNLITNLSPSQFPPQSFTLTANKHRIKNHAATYALCPEGELCIIPGSSGYYEISIASDSAARRTGLIPGSVLKLDVSS